MASGNYSQPSTQASASEVLKVVVLELHELQTQYREVNSRIRNLRIAVGALRELGDKTRPEGIGETQTTEPNAREEKREVARGDRTRSATHPRGLLGNHNPEVQRACRIALMESVVPMALEEIYARIVRRKSFAFVDRQSAFHAISAELHSMLHQGELQRIDDSRKTTWQRVDAARTS
jgi:hypothetical protein